MLQNWRNSTGKRTASWRELSTNSLLIHNSGEEQEFQTVDRNASEENETSVKSDNS
jgi:hypothetical protein